MRFYGIWSHFEVDKITWGGSFSKKNNTLTGVENTA
jgi:hypothetical protein